MPTYTIVQEILDELEHNPLVYEETEDGRDFISCHFMWRMPERMGGHRRIVRAKTFRAMLNQGLIEEYQHETVGNLLDGRCVLRYFRAAGITATNERSASAQTES